ncbi:MAG: alpha/beta hydrolase [Myxococcota bacterium]|jgi:predicted dienelactone hydrolase|nr:alpha/beta hydrolase [Myxococcota bacterium]
MGRFSSSFAPLFLMCVSFSTLVACSNADDALGAAQHQAALSAAPSPAYAAGRIAMVSAKVNGDVTDFYYPTPRDGALHPLALLLQGAKVDKQYYSSFAKNLARYGFVVAIPNHKGIPLMGWTPMQSQIDDMLSYLKGSLASSSLPFKTRVDTAKMAILGHSFGGQAVAYAASNLCRMPTCVGFSYRLPSEVKAAILLGVSLELPLIGGGIPNQDNLVPVAFLQGGVDGKSKPTGTLATYNKVQNPPKVYVEIAGANHYNVCNVNNPSGADKDKNAPSLSQSVSIETNARWSGLFLRAHLLEDAEAYEYIYADGDALDARVTVQSME